MSEALKDSVRAKYGAIARQVEQTKQSASCGGGSGSCCGGSSTDPVTRDLYAETEVRGIPEEAVLASLGCGNPTALAHLAPGEVVLDLGSGGGIDVLLSAQRVGPTGRAYGLDMTDDMLALAEANRLKAGVENAEFLQGDIESVPLPDDAVDVIISNCVVNLAADKRRVINEAFRVLRPGGRLAISDVVVRGTMPSEVRRSMELWVGCIAGALEVEEMELLLRTAGFEEISIEPTRIYQIEDARAFLEGAGLDIEHVAREVGGRVMGAFVRARKPRAAA
jgi:SAM-dependent methyltransferase